MTPADTEIELKFRVPPAQLAAVERALATATAERITLRARYVDTPDGRLAAARMALRLRQEGTRWVQTLKGAGDGLLRRLEHEVPIDAAGNEPPPLDLSRHDGSEAGRAMRRALGDAPPPQVLYGTDIQRLRRVLRFGGARVEVALDQGHIVAGDATEPVCELEFELLSGPPQALLALAERWSARFRLVLDVATKSERGQRLAAGLTAPAVARGDDPVIPLGAATVQARAAMVSAALAHALPNAAAVAAGRHGPDHVHQLRVGLRRLRTVLRVFGPVDELRDGALRTVFAALGGARDDDVLAQTLAPAWVAARAAGFGPPPAAPSWPAAPGPQHSLCDRLSGPGMARLWLQLIALTLPAEPPPGGPAVAEPPSAADTSWSARAAEAVADDTRRVRRALRRWADLPAVDRHRVRKQLKRLRYLLAFSAGLWPERRMARQLSRLRALQEALGRWNDLHTAQTRLAAGPATPVAAFAAGWLAREVVEADAACIKAAQRWCRLPRLGPPRRVRRPRRR